MKQTRLKSFVVRLLAWFKEPRHAVFASALVAVMIAYAVQHYRASYTLPLPWPDEAHFIWQANGFAEHLSLFAPELNSDRTILWMPPGYFIALGTVIRFFGLSLDIARAFSLVLMISAIGVIGLLIRRYSRPTMSLILAVPFVLGAPFVAAGNIARMEALLVLLLLIAFLFLQRGKIVLGLCLLALTPLIHPNGFYFLLSGLIAGPAMLPRPWRQRRPKMSESIMVAVVVLAWIGFWMHAWMHWPDFVHDMKFQFERKEARNIKDAVLTAGSVSLLAVALLGALYCFRKKLPVIFLLAIAAPAWWVAAAGIEMWYRVFFALSYYFLSVMFLIIVHDILRSRAEPWKRVVLSSLVTVAACAVVGWNVMTSSFGEPLVFPDTKPWYKMTAGAGPYITTSDLDKLRSTIDLLAQKKDTSVLEFYPAGDAFFFTTPRRPQIRFSYPLFCTRQPDWYVMHLSERFTPAFNRYALELLNTAQVQPAELRQYLIQSNGGGDQWFLIPGASNPEFRRRR